MKIKVTLNIKTNSEASITFDLVARPFDTVQAIKEKIAGAQQIPFPDQELLFDGVALANESKLATCGIREASCVSFKVKATETTLAQQFSELLQARDLTPDEIGMMYCYKHGVSISQAFSILGFEGKLPDFVSKQKCLTMANGSLTLVSTDTALKPFSAVDEIIQMLQGSDSHSLDITALCAKFLEKFGVNLSSIVGTPAVEFLSKEKETFEVHGDGRVSLQCARETSEVASPCLSARPVLMGPPGLALPAGLSEVEAADKTIDVKQFAELHEKINSDSFNTDVTQTLNDIVAAVSDAIFLDIDHVVTGGSIGKGTAMSACATADVVLFLQGLPTSGHATWHAPLLNSVAGVFDEDFQKDHGIERMIVADNCIKIYVQGPSPIEVDLYLSPAFESYKKAVEVLGEQAADARKFYTPVFAKEQTQFVGRQPSAVKQTIRLMKWWRAQQEWYGPLARPSDEILEFAAIYSAMQTKPADQKEAIANLMSLLSRFDQMRVVWSNNYTKDDVWAPLLSQRPLLMDPANPYVNVADADTFDPTELMVLAKTTHFFW